VLKFSHEACRSKCGKQGTFIMARRVKVTTTLDSQTKQSLEEIASTLQRPLNQIIDHIVDNYFSRTWPRRKKQYLAERKRELERILRLQQEGL
jgi:hypothetical protein